MLPVRQRGYNVHMKRAEKSVVKLFTEVYLIPQLRHGGQALVNRTGGGDGRRGRHGQPLTGRCHTRGYTRGGNPPALAGGG